MDNVVLSIFAYIVSEFQKARRITFERSSRVGSTEDTRMRYLLIL
jgi:hypothetical protein